MIVIVNFGMGNLKSIKNKLLHHKIETTISNEAKVIQEADKLILPGVGNFKKGMDNLVKNKLIDNIIITQNSQCVNNCPSQYGRTITNLH